MQTLAYKVFLRGTLMQIGKSPHILKYKNNTLKVSDS